MLMVSLTHVWCQYEIVLVFLINVVDTETFTSRVCKSCDNIRTNHLRVLLPIIMIVQLLDRKWLLRCILYPVIIVDSLIYGDSVGVCLHTVGKGLGLLLLTLDHALRQSYSR